MGSTDDLVSRKMTWMVADAEASRSPTRCDTKQTNEINFNETEDCSRGKSIELPNRKRPVSSSNSPIINNLPKSPQATQLLSNEEKMLK